MKRVFILDKENDSPSMEWPKYPTIDNLIIHTLKELTNLKTHRINKTSGQDDLPAYILRKQQWLVPMDAAC